MNKIITIIIPIYNAQKYVKRCIESVCNQSYKNLEILCLNDGSTDNTLEILNELSDERIKIINKKNSGVSDTRNYGINISKGKYIMFLDADDFLEKNYIEKMYSAIKNTNSDLIISGYKEINKNTFVEKSIFKNKKENQFDITYPNYLEYYFTSFEFNPCWKQLIKKDLIIDNNIYFDKNIKYGEDLLFSICCYKFSQKTTYIKEYGYSYFKNESSVMNNINISSLLKYSNDNKMICDYILDKFVLKKSNAQKMIEKTFRIYYSIEFKMIKSGMNYKNFKDYSKKIRNDYVNYFEIYNSSQNKNIKEKLNYFLLKNELYIIFYVVKKIKFKIFN